VSAELRRNILYAPIAAPLATLLDDGNLPTLAAINAEAAAAGLLSGSGKPLSFVIPGGSGLSYEERAYWLGEVETRSDNWHDFFNALTWLKFPQTKAALNRHHHFARIAQEATGIARRGPLRDALTQFDECGAIVISSDISLWEDLCAHRWKTLFWQRRAEVSARVRVFVCGHASYDLLRTPHIGLCAKALFLHVDADWLEQPLAQQVADADTRLARRFGGDMAFRPRDFQPLPLLGLPGATPSNESPAYYENTRQFRPLRLA
jgi:hypothetical protein